MRLIGRYASPFVRRVAVTLRHYGLAYEHVPMMPFGESKAEIAKLNPIARVPILELDNGELIWDSVAIIDYLDERADNNSIVPADVEARRQVRRLLVTALGANEKLVTALYERHFRPKEIWHQPWIDSCENQVRQGYSWLEDQFIGPWFTGETLTQADLTVAVFWTFGMNKRPGIFAKIECPSLRELAVRLELTEDFRLCQPEAETLDNELGQQESN